MLGYNYEDLTRLGHEARLLLFMHMTLLRYKIAFESVFAAMMSDWLLQEVSRWHM